MDKHKVTFADSNGHRAALELCCFCQKVTDLNHPETCVHFAEDYVDNKRITPNTKELRPTRTQFFFVSFVAILMDQRCNNTRSENMEICISEHKGKRIVVRVPP